jgi:hypothetical protein
LFVREAQLSSGAGSTESVSLATRGIVWPFSRSATRRGSPPPGGVAPQAPGLIAVEARSTYSA